MKKIMKKKMSAIVAAVCTAALIGCGAGTPSADPHGGSDTDSFYTESDHTENDSTESSHAESGPDADDTASQIVPIVPPDTESVAASEEFRSFLNWEEDTNEEKVYNIFCPDEEFMRIVARCCDTYEAEDRTESVIDDSTVTDPQSSESAEEKSSETFYYGRIGTAEIRWIICHEIGERYLTSLDLSLIDESDSNNVTDLYIVDAADVQKYVEPEFQAAMPLIRDAGLPTGDLSAQYGYTRRLGSGDDGVQRAVSLGITPGVFMYDRQAALDVLGSDDPEVVQAGVADWETFEATAAKAGEKGWAMLSDWTDSFDAFAVGVSGDWLTETGAVKIDDALRAWTEQSELFMKKGYYSKGEGQVFGTFITADEIMDLALSAEADDLTGKYGLCAGPTGWYRGGRFIVVNSLCDQRSLTKKILEEIVFDRDVQRELKAEGLIPNSRDVLPEKAEKSSGGISAADSDSHAEESQGTDASAPDSHAGAIEIVTEFFGGQDPYQVFAEAADRVVLGNVSVFDAYLCDMYGREFSAYFAGEKDRDSAMRVFYTEVSDLISEED